MEIVYVKLTFLFQCNGLAPNRGKPLHKLMMNRIWDAIMSAILNAGGMTSEDFIYDDVIKWKHFRVTGPLCGEFTGHRWIPLTKAGDAELWRILW